MRGDARLGLYDPWRQEEDQLLGRCTQSAALEEVAKHRNVAQQRYLVHAHVRLRLDHTADNHSAAIGHQHLRGGLLRDQHGIQLNVGNPAEVRDGVLDVYVEEDRILRRDLRADGQPQEGVDISHGRRAAQLRTGHDRDALSLADDSLNIVLRDDARPRKDLDQATAFKCREHEVKIVVAARIADADTAGSVRNTECAEERHRSGYGKRRTATLSAGDCR
jgi:hypothetical protein